jgi:hypothetical protein
MSEYTQRHRNRNVRETGEPSRTEDEIAADLRNGQLDEDVACCLDEIDAVLGADQAERDQAEREFNQFDHRTSERTLNRWQAKYAHLGLTYGWCCGMLHLIDSKDES